MTDRRYAEDFHPGQVVELGAYELSAEDLDSFARQWDPQDHHIDAERAAAGAYGGVIASGLHSLAIFQRLAVLNFFVDVAVIAGRDLGPIRFLRPVRPETTLHASAVIDSVEFDDRDRALVTLTGRLAEATSGKYTLEAVMTFYVHARGEGGSGAQ